MLATMPWPELERWRVYFETEPWIWERQAWYAASIVAAIYNVNRNPRKGPSPINDFLMNFEPRRRKTWQEEKEEFKAYARRVNAEARKRKQLKEKREQRARERAEKRKQNRPETPIGRRRHRNN